MNQDAIKELQLSGDRMQELSELVLGHPVQTEETGITPETIHDVERQFTILEPRGDAFDLLMRKYYLFLSQELGRIAVSEPISFPLSFYDRQVQTREQLTEALLTVVTQERIAVLERGRGQMGQIGDYFWESDAADDLQFVKKDFDKLLSFVASDKLSIDPERFHEATQAARRAR